nr:hypothetical protein [Tanacetum cinerariifolium]
PQSGIPLRCCEFGGVIDWYQSTGYRELGRFQNLDYNHFSKNFKSLSPLSDIRTRILPGPSGELDGMPTLPDGRDTTKTVETNLVCTQNLIDSLKKSIEFQEKNFYVDFLHADCVDDHFDALDYWKYKDMYFSGCFDVGGSSTGCDWIDERVGYTDRSLSDISKAEFSKEALLNDGGSSSVTSLSFVLKRNGNSRVKFTRMRAILKSSKMPSLRKCVRSHNIKAGVAKINAGRLNYGSLVSFIGLTEDVCDDEPQLATQLS